MKNWPKGCVAVVTWPTFQILRPLSATAEDANFKFCKQQIDHTKPEKPLGAWPRSLDLLLKFGTPYTLERLKIQSSNFARWLKVKDTKSKNEKFWKSASGLGCDGKRIGCYLYLTRSSAIAERPRCSLFKLWQNISAKSEHLTLLYVVGVWSITTPSQFFLKYVSYAAAYGSFSDDAVPK